MTVDRLFGAHMSIAGGHDKAVRAAHALGFHTVQVFTKSTNQWRAKPLEPIHLEAFRTSLAETSIKHPVAHNSYLINLASPDDALWQKSIDAMTEEVERAEALGIADLVTHPGAHVGSGEEAGCDRIARALDEIHRRTAGYQVRIDLETTAGQGSCLGDRFEHLGTILGLVADPARLGICIDTCHIHAAGYALDTWDHYNEAMAQADASFGLERVRVWHLNDSVKGLGSHVDRHAGLGRGTIGLEAFGWIVNDPRFAAIPMILETPKGPDPETGEELDAINLRHLLALRRPEADASRPKRTRKAKG